MEYDDDYERQPHEKLYFGVLSALDMLKRLPADKREQILKMYNVTEADLLWQARQASIQPYWDEETRTGDWNRVSDSWNKIRASYNEHKNITQP